METIKSAGLMTGAMAGFATGDALIKKVSTTLSTGQIMLILGSGGMIVFAIVLKLKGQPLLTSVFWNRTVMVRNGFEMLSALLMVTALSRVQFTSLTVVLQATPLLVTAGAALVLGMVVGWRRWTAIFVGFVGVLLILRPGLEDFDPNTLFALGAAISLAARDLSTRAIPHKVDSVVLAFYGFAAIVPMGLITLTFDGPSGSWSYDSAAFMLAAIALTAIAYYAITAAMRIGDISAVAPFRYTRLIFGLIIGLIVFGESLDGMAIVGATLILGSGLYTLSRESLAAIPSRSR